MAALHERLAIKMGRGAVIHDDALSCFLQGQAITIGDYARIDGNVKIEGGNGVKIGSFVHIAWGCHINTGGGRVEIGDHSGLGSHAIIIGGMPDLSYPHISAAEPADRNHPIRMETMIGKYVFIGAGAIILPGITIADFAVIGAGSVVTKNVGSYEKWFGNPATFQGYQGKRT